MALQVSSRIPGTGNPVPGTRLYLRNRRGEPEGSVSQTVSDESGLFRFEMPMPSPIRGQSLFLFGQSPEGNLAWKLIPQVNATDVTLVMPPTVHVYGQVVGPEGEIVSGASVRFQAATSAHAGGITLSAVLRDQAPEVITNAEGNFLFPGIPAYGFADFQLRHPQYGEGWARVEVGGVDSSPERPILIDPPIVIEGIVLRKSDRTPLSAARVTLGYSNVTTVSDADGHFRFDGLTRWDTGQGPPSLVAEWEDRVVVLTLSIDAEMATAAAHLETNGWRHTRNMWVGPGAWDAEPARQFNLEAVPSFYLVNPDGTIHLAGNPHRIDLEATIAEMLE